MPIQARSLGLLFRWGSHQRGFVITEPSWQRMWQKIIPGISNFLVLHFRENSGIRVSGHLMKNLLI